ncbi:MAG: NAD-dependent epimerase/dehydratase family protein [Caldilineales bacterium]|nr:NAD-dependent epimerase/dehydratase family protein [Caldilineales bacterium]
MSHMIALVTGCAGFIGSQLTERLLKDGHEVVGLDAFTSTYERSAKERNLRAALNHAGFHFVETNLTHAELGGMLDNIDVVFHLAGEPGVRASWGEGFAAYAQNNVLATERLLDACRGKPLQRFVYAGSSSVYGDAPEMPWAETTLPQPRSPYAITKLAAEHLCQAYRASFGVPTVAVRYFTVYGPRQRPDMAFHRFFKAILSDKPIPIFGSGEQTRDFTYVDDIVAGTLAAASVPEAIGGVFNLGGGSRIVLNDLLVLLEDVVERPIKISRLPKQAGDVRHTWADTTLAQTVLGFQPQVGLAEGLRNEYLWMQDWMTIEA